MFNFCQTAVKISGHQSMVSLHFRHFSFLVTLWRFTFAIMIKKRIFFSLVLTLICSSLFSQHHNLFQHKVFIGGKGDTLPYRILYPENYDSTKKYPLILFLHGAGERGNDNEKQLVHGSSLFLDSLNRHRFPSIVIFPQCPTDSYWASVLVDRTQSPLSLAFDYTFSPTAPMQNVISLVREFIERKKVKNSKAYIMGLSMGGMGTFEAVYRHPELFAAAIPICGGGDVSRYDKRIKKIPFWVFHGDKDSVVDVKHSRDMVAKLKKIKAKVKYTEYPGVNHNSWDYAFAEQDLLNWLFRQ
jgi:predicted peptidase